MRSKRSRGSIFRWGWALALAGGLLCPLDLAAQVPGDGASPSVDASAAPPEGAAAAAAEGAGAAPAGSATAEELVADESGARRAPAKKRRGGLNPCLTPDPGFGIYDRWEPVGVGHMIAPVSPKLTKTGGFDLVVHFHGHEAIRKEFVKEANGIVLVGVDLGIGSGAYSSGFASPETMTRLLASTEAAMARRTGNKKAHVRRLALSSWSAGYGAIEQILRQKAGKKVDAVVLLDSLHAGYVDESASEKQLKTNQIEPFLAFAKKAARGDAVMFLSHSSIEPPGYASTTEVAHWLEKQLGGKPKSQKREDVLGLDMVERFDKGAFHVRGYTGNDKPDHCAHIGLMADVIEHRLEPRWKTPASPKPKPAKPAKATAKSTPAPAAPEKKAPAAGKAEAKGGKAKRASSAADGRGPKAKSGTSKEP